MYELGNAALGNGHSECVGRELASERVAHGPAHNSPGVHVQHGRQVQPALARWDVGHIAEPASIGPLGFKAPPDMLGYLSLTGGLDDVNGLQVRDVAPSRVMMALQQR